VGEKDKNRERSESGDEKREKNKKSENQMRCSPLENVAPLKDIHYRHAPSRKSKERIYKIHGYPKTSANQYAFH